VEFSRREQFQAVLVGMTVADAAAHGQIKALLSLGLIQTLPFASAWSSTLIQVAGQLSSGIHDRVAVDAAIQNDTEIAALVQIPVLLRYIDDPAEQSLMIARQLGLPIPNPVLTVQLHQLLQSLLSYPQNQSLSMRLDALQVWSHGPQSGVMAQASAAVVQTAGDFRLAIASLSAAGSPLLPVLVGMMCTALRGLRTIPVLWRQALLPPQSSWYADRWAVRDEMALRGIATDLWKAWAGL